MKRFWLLLLAIAAASMALSPGPFARQWSLVDRVAAAARAGLPTAIPALEILERVAEGRMATAALDLETKVGLKPGQLHTPEFKDESVRAHALLEIGELDSPEALAYLQGLRPEDIQPDTSG